MHELETRVLGDRYELRSVIATGGMGRVWRAHDQRLRRAVAVKVLRGEFAGDPEFIARFRAEARHTALLRDEHVAAVYDYGETGVDGEGLAWLVMELVEGEPLSALRRREGALEADRVVDLLRQAASGLAAAHAAGVVHRDVKPGNLLVRPDGSLAITDFGIAWSAASVSLTGTGEVIGTAHYLSPEQARGEQATAASDVYALGMVGYELVTGRRAFPGDSPVAVLRQQIDDEPDPLPDTVPAGVRQLLGSMLAKDPADRLADGAAVLAAVERLVERGLGPATAKLTPARHRRTAPRAPSPAAAAGRCRRRGRARRRRHRRGAAAGRRRRGTGGRGRPVSEQRVRGDHPAAGRSGGRCGRRRRERRWLGGPGAGARAGLGHRHRARPGGAHHPAAHDGEPHHHLPGPRRRARGPRGPRRRPRTRPGRRLSGAVGQDPRRRSHTPAATSTVARVSTNPRSVAPPPGKTTTSSQNSASPPAPAAPTRHAWSRSSPPRLGTCGTRATRPARTANTDQVGTADHSVAPRVDSDRPTTSSTTPTTARTAAVRAARSAVLRGRAPTRGPVETSGPGSGGGTGAEPVIGPVGCGGYAGS